MLQFEHRAVGRGDESRSVVVASHVLRQAKRKMPQRPPVCDPGQSAG